MLKEIPEEDPKEDLRKQKLDLMGLELLWDACDLGTVLVLVLVLALALVLVLVLVLVLDLESSF